MKIATTAKEVKEIVEGWKKEGKRVGFVPTMGYLHEGHKSLIDISVMENDKTVVSVFVNPTQFAPNEDFESYPRNFMADAKLCEEAGADLIFHPEPEEMYAEDFCTYVEMEDITKGLCGKTRPTHFRGVCTVVLKLFNIVRPDRAYFGQKDAQQLAVIKRMVRDLNLDVKIEGCPIVREGDGLAKSSRNTYLNKEERLAAVVISRAVKRGLKMVEEGERDSKTIIEVMRTMIESEPLAKIDYVEIVDWHTLKPMEKINGPLLAAVAVYIGKTRLIDNFIVEF